MKSLKLQQAVRLVIGVLLRTAGLKSIDSLQGRSAILFSINYKKPKIVAIQYL